MANSFSAAQFRKKALLSQGLLRRGSFGRGGNGVLKCVKQLGYVQIDTISVVERAHNHVLWTRVPGFRPCMLDNLLRRKELFEYWFHAAAYLPMDNFRFAIPRMRAIKTGEKHWFANKDKRLMRRICRRIQEEGPLMARDFEDKRQGNSGWWDWKPAKQALEQLFMEGDLMVVERRGFQKVYDLTERVLPASVNTTEPDTHELASYLINTTIRSHGFASQKAFTYLRKGKNVRVSVKEQLNQQVSDRRLIETYLPCGTRVYADPDVASRKRVADNVAILSPFDNCVIQRERCRKIFDFDFQIECYLPESKRKYGYFSLPILYRDRFVGRIDCKADRQSGVLGVKSFHPNYECEEDFFRKLGSALHEYAAFNDCDRVSMQCDTAGSQRLAEHVVEAG